MKTRLFTAALADLRINPGDIIFGDPDDVLVIGKGAVGSFDKFGII